MDSAFIFLSDHFGPQKRIAALHANEFIPEYPQRQSDNFTKCRPVSFFAEKHLCIIFIVFSGCYRDCGSFSGKIKGPPGNNYSEANGLINRLLRLIGNEL